MLILSVSDALTCSYLLLYLHLYGCLINYFYQTNCKVMSPKCVLAKWMY